MSHAESAIDEFELEVIGPEPDADTCKIKLDRELAPGGTHFFETQQEAKDFPAIRELLRVPGIHSVIAKGEVLILARHVGADWSSIISPAVEAIRQGLTAPDDVSPVDAIAAAAAGVPGPEEELRARVQEIIDNEINPSVAAHGGYISLLDVQGTRVFLHMGGGCQGCAMSTATLKHGVEAALKSQIPEISEILDTTDHAAGTNPFFQDPQF